MGWLMGILVDQWMCCHMCFALIPSSAQLPSTVGHPNLGLSKNKNNMKINKNKIAKPNPKK